MKRLVHSSKAILVLIVTALAFASLLAGKATWSDVEGLLKWIVGPFVLAVGVEDAAKHLSSRAEPPNPRTPVSQAPGAS